MAGRGKASLKAAENFIDDIEHLFYHPGCRQYGGHENKQGNGRELIVGHKRKDARGQDINHVQIAENKKKHHAQSASYKSQRQTGHKEENE
jgi:hypothetical protein